MRIAICEDDAKMRNQQKETIEDWAEHKKAIVDVLCYDSAEAFMMAWPEMSFDLAFFDIEMKNITGIELAAAIRRIDSAMLIVFVTSFSQYAVKGYDVNAMHYLIKPLSATKLHPILDKAHIIWKVRKDSYLLIPDKEGLRKLPFDEINYISIQSHIASVHTDKAVYEMRITMKELADTLPDFFVRIHRSYIVNLYKVDCMYKDSLLLTNDERLPISRNSHRDASESYIRLNMGR